MQSHIPEGSIPDSSTRERLLIVPEPGLCGALLAEPGIRALHLDGAGDPEITVCHETADLFAGHPAVHALAYSYPERTDQFDRIITLQAGRGKGTNMEKIEVYAAGAGAVLHENQPKVFLTSFDLIRVQRFGLNQVVRPRVALTLPTYLPAAEEEGWIALCRALTERMGCGVVLLGDEGTVNIPGGKDFRGKLMAREMAAVLSQCDVLITSEAEMIWMGLSVRVPGVFIGTEEMARMLCPDREQGGFECATGPHDVIEAMSRLERRIPAKWIEEQ